MKEQPGPLGVVTRLHSVESTVAQLGVPKCGGARVELNAPQRKPTPLELPQFICTV